MEVLITDVVHIHVKGIVIVLLSLSWKPRCNSQSQFDNNSPVTIPGTFKNDFGTPVTISIDLLFIANLKTHSWQAQCNSDPRFDNLSAASSGILKERFDDPGENFYRPPHHGPQHENPNANLSPSLIIPPRGKSWHIEGTLWGAWWPLLSTSFLIAHQKSCYETSPLPRPVWQSPALFLVNGRVGCWILRSGKWT